MASSKLSGCNETGLAFGMLFLHSLVALPLAAIARFLHVPFEFLLICWAEGIFAISRKFCAGINE